MKRSFFIADTHFGHANVLKHDKRPFADIEAHDKSLIENWNRALNDDDECYTIYIKVRSNKALRRLAC